MNSTRFARPYTFVVTAAWVTIIIGLMLINLRQIRVAQYAMATIDARANVDEDIAFRLWVSSQSGVYVPVTDRSQPDPSLSHIPERDIVTPTGKLLTLINATGMLRLIKADYPDLYGIRGHLTGLTPLHGETAPDEWEKAALLKFQEGIKEISEVVSIDGVPYLRLIKPMCAGGQCLKYHANYSTEAVGGGESIAVPLSPYLARMQKEMIFCVACYGIVLAIGLTGIGLGRNRLIHHIEERDKTEDALRVRTVELEKANRELVQIPTKLIAAQEEERKRVGGELHDSISQTLVALKYRVEAILLEKNCGGSAQVLETLEQLVPALQRSIDETRAISMGMRPAVLDSLGLISALEWLRREFMNFHPKCHVELETNIDETEIERPLKVSVFRITQEALGNIAKHSRAEWVDVTLVKKNGFMELAITDDGVGFDLNEVCTPCSVSLGLTTMRERAEILGGTFSIISIPGEGTTVRALWQEDKRD